MWSNFPVHEMEDQKALPEYIYDLEPFKETRTEKRTPKENFVTEHLRFTPKKPTIDNLLKSKPEHLDPNYTQKYKKTD